MNVNEFCQQYACDRKDCGSVKWNAIQRYHNADILPVWIADADFKTSEKIQEALQKTVNSGVFGYQIVPQSYYDACIAWEKERYGYLWDQKWLRFSHGVVSLIAWSLNTFTAPEDEILILTPVYPPFHKTTETAKRKLVCFELTNNDGVYQLDFEALEAFLQVHSIKLFIHCNPHNPIGRVWSAKEQDQLVALMQKYNVLIISDEIHQDLTFKPFTPTALALNGSYSHRIITLTSLSKTFSLAGCSVAQAVIEDDDLRQQFDDYVKTVSHGATNIMGFAACEAGYREGAPWLCDFLNVIQHNEQLLRKELNDTPIQISPLEGTYLAWLQLCELNLDEPLQTLFPEKIGVLPNFGETFSPTAKNFIRLNLAADPAIIYEAAQRIKKLYE